MEIIRVPKHSTPESNALLHAELDKMCCRNPRDDFGVFYVSKPEYGPDWSENFDGGNLYLGWDDNSRTFVAKYVFDVSGKTTIFTMEDGRETAQGVVSWLGGFKHAKKWICRLLKKEIKIPPDMIEKFEKMEITE